VKRSSSASHSTPEPKGDPRVVRGLGVITRMSPPPPAPDPAMRGFLQHPRQIAGQQDRRPAGIAEPPHAVAQIIDAVAALDAEREAHLLPQPVLVQGQRRTVVYFDGHGPTVRATAHPSAPTITPHLRPMLLAVGAEHERLIHRRWLDRFAEHGERGDLAWRQHGAQHGRAAQTGGRPRPRHRAPPSISPRMPMTN
jgi:hypothetical protein